MTPSTLPTQPNVATWTSNANGRDVDTPPLVQTLWLAHVWQLHAPLLLDTLPPTGAKGIVSTITASLTGVMTLQEFIALNIPAVWTVDDYTPHGAFHDDVASFEGTIAQPGDYWQVSDVSTLRTYTLDSSMLPYACGRYQFDVGTDGVDLRSLLLVADHSCGDPGTNLVPESSTLLLLLMGFLLHRWLKGWRF